MSQNTLGRNITFPIYNADGTAFNGLELKKATVDSVVMSLGDKVTGDVYYIDNTLAVTMQEYIVVNGVKYTLVSPPTIVREGMVADNTQLKGMTKYSFTFYHPMYMLGNFPFTDIAVTQDEEKYLSQNKTFSWIGNLFEFVQKLRANLKNTQWAIDVEIPQYEQDGSTITPQWKKALKQSDVLSFDKNFISDALKTAYDIWEIPFVISHYESVPPSGYTRLKWVRISEIHQSVTSTTAPFWLFIYNLNSVSAANKKIHYCKVFNEDTLLFDLIPCKDSNNNVGMYDVVEGVFYGSNQEVTFEAGGEIGKNKKFNITFGLPINKIYDKDGNEYVFRFGKGLGLKNNSRTPRNNKIVTRIVGYGSDRNVPYGYPQIRWYGNQDWDYTINNDASDPHSYPIYQGIVGGEYVKLIKHPFTRKTLMPSSYTESLFNKISPYLERVIPSGSIVDNPSYDPDTELVDYLDAIGNDYPNNINPQSPSCEIHQFEDIKPEFNANDSYKLIAVYPLNNDMSVATDWDDTMDDNGEYIQSYFKITLPQLQFDIYACAAITEKMQINMRSGACLGCTFDVEVDWDDYKRNFYNSNGDFDPVPHTQAGDGHVRDITKYPDSSQGHIDVIVKKDLDTFGTLMPNMYQQPKGETTTGANNGDLFVILGISLPNSYVHDAELRLDAAMKAFMIENNDYYFDYPLKFDEHFLATHTNILSQIRNNNVVRFNYNGVELQLYISRISIKYGDSVLPQYDITLTDDIDVVLNKIGVALNDIQHINYELLNMKKNFATTIVNVERDVRSGKVNRFYYYAQEWSNDATIGYDVNDLQAPYFSYNGEFWIFNPKESGYYTMAEMGQPQESSVSSPTSWVRMISEFKYIITEAIFGSYAHFGSFIINGDWMISQHGKKNNVDSTDYQSFDPNFAKGCYLCQGIDVNVNYNLVGSNVFIGGKTYTITLIGENFYADSGVTSQQILNVRMYNGSSNVGSTINLTSANPTQTLTFTPPSTGLYYVRVNMQSGGTHGMITAYVNNVFVPNFAIDALQGTSYQRDAYLSGILESEDIDMGNKISIDAKNGAISMIGPTSINDDDHKPAGNKRMELFRLDFFHDDDALTRYAMWRMNNGVTLKNWAYRELWADPYYGFQSQQGDYNDKYGRLSPDGVTISWGSSYGDKDVEISPEGVTIRRGSTYTTKTWEQIFNNQ